MALDIEVAYSEELRREYEAGDRGALLRMIWICAGERLALPEWAAAAFDQIFLAMKMGAARSWDDAFGPPVEMGAAMHLETLRISVRKVEIYCRVRKIHESEGVPIDSALFARVGRELKVGKKTVVSEVYMGVRRAVEKLAREVRDK